MLIVLEFGVDEDHSAFKQAFRDDWGPDQYWKASLLNELRYMRADNVALHGDGSMTPILVQSPKQIEAEELKEAQNRAIRGGIMAQLHGGTNG